MGLMDILAGAASGGGSASTNPMMETLTKLFVQHQGGLNGVLDQLKAAGLSKQVDSWIGTGANLPVSADQIKAALGNEKIDQVAQAAGISHVAAAKHIAEQLPGLVDGITPQGSMPEGDLASQAFAFMKSNFFK